MAGCQWIGAEQTHPPYNMCGCTTLTGKNYCGDHYWRVYKKGSATAGRRNERAIDEEIAELKRLQELDDIEA